MKRLSIYFLSVILIDSGFRTGKNYCPEVFLEECKNVIKEKRFLSILLTIQTLLDSDRENSDEENSDKENSDEENCDEENQKNANVTNKKKFINFLVFIQKWSINIIKKNKEKLKKKASERYQNLSEEEKEKRQKKAQDI